MCLDSEPTRILKQPEYKEVQRNRDVVFECKVKHDPSLIPTMTWLKDNGELPDDERYLLFMHNVQDYVAKYTVSLSHYL